MLIILTATAGAIYLKRTQSTGLQQTNNISVRANYAKEAFRIIRKHPFFGVGIGDKKYMLIDRDTSLGDKRYIEFGLDTRPENVFNPHNQFLSFWLDAGLIPVVCLLCFFVLEFIKAFRHKNILHIGLLYCFCLFCFTDMALTVQRGQVFFLFFILVLGLPKTRNNSFEKLDPDKS